MTIQTGDVPTVLMLWWWRRLARRRHVAAAALDMQERYGAAAYGIARNSARRGTRHERRFWRQVARRLRIRIALARLTHQRPWPAAIFGPRVIARPDVIGIAIGTADMAAGDDRR
jgi:hypothetical protein